MFLAVAESVQDKTSVSLDQTKDPETFHRSLLIALEEARALIDDLESHRIGGNRGVLFAQNRLVRKSDFALGASLKGLRSVKTAADAEEPEESP